MAADHNITQPATRSRGKPDFLLLFLTISLVMFGLLVLYSASSVIAFHEYNDRFFFLKRQMISALIGLAGMFVFMNLPLKFWKKTFGLAGFGSIVLLTLVYVPGLGIEINDTKRWFGFAGMTLQPIEFAKLGLILYLSGLIYKKNEGFQNFKSGMLPALVVSGIFFVLIMNQPDFGGALILIMISLIMIYCGGTSLKNLFFLVLPVAGVALFYLFSAEYRIARVTSFMDPWNDGLGGLGDGFQLIQSYYALSHGGLWGAGFGQSVQKILYLPYAQSDFIFAILAEEFGFIGAMLFLLTLGLLLWRALLLGMRSSDRFAIMVSIGIFAMILIQTIVNIGGTIGLMPITGLPLPFVSFGGSALMALLFSVGILLSISRHVNKERTIKSAQSD